MKKLLFGLFLTPIFLTAGQYVSMSAGADYAHHTDLKKGEKVGYKVGASYGYKFVNGLRGEFEIAYRDGHKRNEYLFVEGEGDTKKHVSHHSISYLCNCLYDIGGLTTFNVTPYVGGGVGLCCNSYESKTQTGDAVTNRDKATEDRFAWQLIGGVKYPVSENLEIAGEYRYFNGDYHAKNHSFSAALVRSF
jgi:opacity protein-like surface antigen